MILIIIFNMFVVIIVFTCYDDLSDLLCLDARGCARCGTVAGQPHQRIDHGRPLETAPRPEIQLDLAP